MNQNDPDVVELVNRFNKWRQIYRYAGKSAPDEATWENGRLQFRYGYPHPDWWGYVLEAADEGNYRVLRATTERRGTPVESLQGTFGRLEDAGKFIVYKVATYLMIECRMAPLNWKWEDAGLDPQVNAYVQSDRVVKYVLRDNPEAYLIMTRGDMPYSHILPLSYDELDAVLLKEFPENVTSRLTADKN